MSAGFWHVCWTAQVRQEWQPDQKHLYIGSSQNDKVLRYHFHSGKVETFVHSGDGGLKGTAGMAFSNDGWF
jgi:hypothetical protein